MQAATQNFVYAVQMQIQKRKYKVVLSDLRIYHHGRGLTRSLKLTEGTVDDFAVRNGTIRKMATSSARMRYIEPAARRRSLAPIR